MILQSYRQCITLFSALNEISAWLRDITGLSNQALSAAACNPLLGVLDALPICMVRRFGLRVRIRSVRSASPLRAVKVILAKDRQYIIKWSDKAWRLDETVGSRSDWSGEVSRRISRPSSFKRHERLKCLGLDVCRQSPPSPGPSMTASRGNGRDLTYLEWPF